MSQAGGEIVAAVVSGLFVLVATWFGAWFNGRIRRLEEALARALREVEVCEQERGRLRRNLQLVVGAIVGLIPERERLDLLAKIDGSIEPAGGGAGA